MVTTPPLDHLLPALKRSGSNEGWVCRDARTEGVVMHDPTTPSAEFFFKISQANRMCVDIGTQMKAKPLAILY